MEYAIFPIATLVASIVYANTIGKNKVFGDKARKERSMCIYNLVPVRAPALTGFLLKAFVTILKVPILGRFVLNILMYQNQLYKVRELASVLVDEVDIVYYPIVKATEEQEQLGVDFDMKLLDIQGKAFNDGFRHWTISDYVSAYTSKRQTVLSVMEKIIGRVKEMQMEENSVNCIIAMNELEILQQAAKADSRYRRGETMGPLDGVPIVVKDSVDVEGYVSSHGTSFLGVKAAKSDAIVIQKLRATGAIVIGKTQMHEIGLGVTGFNKTFGTTRNPYNVKYHTGGSSSGSAAAVAMGLVPIAVGTDGGGSIRIPSSLCGVVGLKSTYNRMDDFCNICPSVGHVGPIGNNVKDVALAYAIMASSENAPKVHVPSFEKEPMDWKTLRVGVFYDYVKDSDKHVYEQCLKTIDVLKSLGATIVPITLPHTQQIHLAHSITILTEMAQGTEQYFEKFGKFSYETQASLLVGRNTSSRDFLAAQRVRAYAMKEIKHAFTKMDVFISPATAMTAPKIPPGSTKHGESNLAQTATLMRYALHGNLTGIPGIVLPAGYDSANLPIGIQIQAYNWNESLLLQVANALTPHLPSITKPSVYTSNLTF